MRTETTYTCEICEKRSLNKDEIRKCESTPVEQIDFQIGDRVRFKEDPTWEGGIIRITVSPEDHRRIITVRWRDKSLL